MPGNVTLGNGQTVEASGVCFIESVLLMVFSQSKLMCCMCLMFNNWNATYF